MNSRDMLARDSGWFLVDGVPYRVLVVNPHLSKCVTVDVALKWVGVVRKAARAVHAVLSSGDIRPACVEINVYLWRGKKVLLPRSDPISPSNCNTGVTVREPGGKATIMVFREEEAVKTIVHEILHAYRLGDWAASDTDMLSRCEGIQRREGVRVTSGVGICPTEAIVDAVAVKIVSDVFGGRPWVDCVRHAERVSRRLMERCVRDFGGEWKQSTHAFEYYCVKPYFMRRIECLMRAHGGGLQKPNKEDIRRILPATGRATSSKGLGRIYRRSTIRMRMTPHDLGDIR